MINYFLINTILPIDIRYINHYLYEPSHILEKYLEIWKTKRKTLNLLYYCYYNNNPYYLYNINNNYCHYCYLIRHHPNDTHQQDECLLLFRHCLKHYNKIKKMKQYYTNDIVRRKCI